MGAKQLKMDLYRRLGDQQSRILAEIARIPDKIGMPSNLKGKIGASGTVSGNPVGLRKIMREAISEGEKKATHLKYAAEEVRRIVKEVYGDEYDAVVCSSCEAALWIIFDTLFSPPMGKGDAYQAYYIAPYERHLHHHGAYGRPFPPKYKDIFADHGVTAGEMGFLGKRQTNLTTVIVPFEGGKYECHGMKYYPCCLLTNVDPERSYEKMAKVAARYGSSLAGITSLSYDTPGYGYGDKDADGTPRMQKLLAQIAREYDVPYLVDNATGVPFIGSDIRKIGADIIVYSMDKIARAPHCGLIIGKEEPMIHLRRALGTHTGRTGAPAYGKAAYVTCDPGRQALAGAIVAMKIAGEKPEIYTSPVDTTYEIVLEEMKNNVDPELSKDLIVTKTYSALGVEINYANTWSNGKIGFPIFSIEDMYAGTDMLGHGMEVMGIIPVFSYDATIGIRPGGQGTMDDNGQLIEENMRYVIRGIFKMMEVIWKFWLS